ncbi:MAG: hypothetical protein ACJ71Q_01260 [Terriglobales bacterium]
MGYTGTIDKYLAMLANAVKQRNVAVPSSMCVAKVRRQSALAVAPA